MGEMIGVATAVFGLVSWIFKVWIISPLSSAINRLDNSIAKMQGLIDDMRTRNEETRKSLAVMESSLKAAHKRLDDLNDKVNVIQKEQIECLRGKEK